MDEYFCNEDKALFNLLLKAGLIVENAGDGAWAWKEDQIESHLNNCGLTMSVQEYRYIIGQVLYGQEVERFLWGELISCLLHLIEKVHGHNE